MRLRSRNPKATLVSLTITIVGGVWRIYAWTITAEQLPQDYGKVSQFLADPPTWLPWAVLLASVLVLAWSLWPTEDEPKPEGGNAANTLGHSSPAFAGNQFHGPATCNLGAVPEPQSNEAHEIRFHRLEAMDKCPPMPISAALAYLMSLGRTKEQARLTLQQAFSEDRMIVWGRAEIPPVHLQAPFAAQETWQIVRPAYWQEFRLTEAAFDANEDQPQTEAQQHVQEKVLRRYWSLRVSEGQLREEWPRLTGEHG